MINILVFEDEEVSSLQPITTSRPAFAISCACIRLVDWLSSLKENVTFDVRTHLQELVVADFPKLTEKLNAKYSTTLIISALIVPCQSNFRHLNSLLESLASAPADETRVVAIDQNRTAVAFAAPTAELLSPDSKLCDTVSALKSNFDGDCSIALDAFRYPHDVVAFNQKHFVENLESLIACSELKEIRDGVYAHESANVDPTFIAKTDSGPVLFAENAKVGPFTFFDGPVYVGPNCTILEHASLKDYVCLTNTIKAGGEIEATVIEPYSNKQHHGFLGHSYLGSWINIGAGTCNSDLKNTYGKVNATYGQDRVQTNLQFVGCFVGDYSKTAINTSIFTGKSVGVCSMLYGFVTTNVPSFVNYAKTFASVTGVPADVMVTTQKRMFGRRGVEQRAVDVQLIHDMFKLTAYERNQDSIAYETPKL